MKKLNYWLLLLICLSLTVSASADEVRLHFLRSPLGINWTSPWGLSISALKNQVAPVGKKRAYSIGHVFVEVKCDSLGEHIFRGMTSVSNSEERELLFKKHYGLGVLFHTYAGKLEKDESILRDLAPYQGSKRRAELIVKVSPSACARMISYSKEFEELGYGKMYSGLQADPLKREGAGCSAFAVSFLRVAGLMDDFSEEWKQVIDVPTRFVGGPLTNSKVKLLSILTKPFARWSARENHIHLEAWDPEAMHSWVKKMYYQVHDGIYQGRWPLEISREKDTYTIEIDMTERATPTGPFWI